MTTSDEWIKKINDPSLGASKWLRQGLTSALTRDPVDALNDAEQLVIILDMRWKEIQKKGAFK